MIVERFAPSPTGLLHLGHAFSAWVGWNAARMAGGRFLLRIEDLDTARVRPAYRAAILEDLAWLGLDWDQPVIDQSTRTDAYLTALNALDRRGLTYRCACTRRDIALAITAPQENAGPDGPVYPGTCRDRAVPGTDPYAMRLNMVAAVEALGGARGLSRLAFEETGDGVTEHGPIPLDAKALIDEVGDIVLCRRDGAVAYHLAVVVDDAWQRITHVTRGADLFTATPIHRVLQGLLDLPVPVYRHHRLVRDQSGKRLAKRDDARAIAGYRQAGLAPKDVLAMAGINDPLRPEV